MADGSAGPAMGAAAPPAVLAGLSGAALHFAGALKSTPPGAALPFDLTLAALALLLPALALMLCAEARRWRLAPALGLPLAAAAALWLWLVLAGAWSRSAGILAAKLPEAVLLGPAMLLAGLAIGAEARARRAFCAATLAIGALTAATVAWGLATEQVVLGGTAGTTPPDQLRVQYQLAGLAIASAAGLAAIRAAEARLHRRPAAALRWGAVLAGLALAALLPGGRAALAGLVLAAGLAPALRLWRGGRPLDALAWALLAALAIFAGLALLLLDPSRVEGLRTLERLADPAIGISSGRAPLWAAALREAGGTAPFGLGPGGFAIAAGHGERRGLHPHSHALEALAEGGLPGFALWLIAFGGAGVAACALGARAEPGRAARIAALVLPMAVAVLVSTDLGNRMAWFALGLALSLGIGAGPRPAAAIPGSRRRDV
ncbi:hypothetical protein GCM10010964_20750 [Caldovatus sediminis]|uniref:O-antigen ligase-related domain-containing protein n=1 Tax=Caldovatus sediminis TaxID=2041189 RepID=A0A8J3ECG0_9PROT|nr:O-antigen ligase family protein [Caldovatus sediminis]GGG32720.1 hypothetical protein GCM10010964_20750 [Caldovatus sediminis]